MRTVWMRIVYTNIHVVYIFQYSVCRCEHIQRTCTCTCIRCTCAMNSIYMYQCTCIYIHCIYYMYTVHVCIFCTSNSHSESVQDKLISRDEELSDSEDEGDDRRNENIAQETKRPRLNEEGNEAKSAVVKATGGSGGSIQSPLPPEPSPITPGPLQPPQTEETAEDTTRDKSGLLREGREGGRAGGREGGREGGKGREGGRERGGRERGGRERGREGGRKGERVWEGRGEREGGRLQKFRMR